MLLVIVLTDMNRLIFKPKTAKRPELNMDASSFLKIGLFSIVCAKTMTTKAHYHRKITKNNLQKSSTHILKIKYSVVDKHHTVN